MLRKDQTPRAGLEPARTRPRCQSMKQTVLFVESLKGTISFSNQSLQKIPLLTDLLDLFPSSFLFCEAYYGKPSNHTPNSFIGTAAHNESFTRAF